MKFITVVLYTIPKSKVKSLRPTLIQAITGYFLWCFWLVFLSRHYAHSLVIQMHIKHMTDEGKRGNVSNQFVEQSSKSVFKAADDFVRSCLSNYMIQTHKFVVERADPHVSNEEPVGAQVIICSEFILVWERSLVISFLLCTCKTQPFLLSDMVANKTSKRTPPLLQVPLQTCERRPFDKWTNDFHSGTLVTILNWECSHVALEICKYAPDTIHGKVHVHEDALAREIMPKISTYIGPRPTLITTKRSYIRICVVCNQSFKLFELS